ncbi:MAG: LamG-like jellyroll fold domain-containing protein, partial [Pirellulales bacterium]
AQRVLDAEPSVYLRLDESSGTVLADSSAHTEGPLDGTIIGTASLAVEGPFGPTGQRAIGIGGDAHLEIPDNPRIDPTRAISFSFWIKPDRFANTWMPLLYKGNGNSNQRSYALWLQNNGSLVFDSSDSSGRQSYQTSGGVIATGQWTHIAGVVDRDAGRLKLWVNGSERLSGALRTGDIRGNDNRLLIGHTSENSASYSKFDGSIDEFASWDRALTSNELLAPYFDSKWLGEANSTDELISSFGVAVSERLLSRSVNFQGWEFDTFGGNTYVKLSNRTWQNGQAWAIGEGGYLAVPDTAEENQFLWQRFGDPPNHDLWIGLSDETTQVPAASEGVWKTVQGTDPSYTAWGNGEPNSGDGYDYAYISQGDGRWYDGWQTWAHLYPVVEFEGDTDRDGDGMPDVIDWRPDDPKNGWDLRAAGDDGIFDTADDVLFDPRASYNGATGINVTIADGPLPPGDYRLTITGAVTDTVGNRLDGDRDTVAGGDFVQTFSVNPLPDSTVYEGQDNGTRAKATPLTLTEDSQIAGFWTTELVGFGSQDPVNNTTFRDEDWWSFTGAAGDRVTIAMDTPQSGVNAYLELY